MANSPAVRIPLELHEEAERIALMKSAADQVLISKNEVLKLAVELGLKQIRSKYEKTAKSRDRRG